MSGLLAAFITGLTAGGLSCLAVQGGLLTSSLAGQAEKGYQKGSNYKPNLTKPLLLFLLAKLVTHTMLGFLLGWLGTLLQLTPLSRAILQLAIGVFMIGNGLRMLNVHPFFRFFSFEPPAFIRRYIRRKSKEGENWITPLVLGGMTILIPCGITQTMMALAVASGNPLTGAAILFAFVLGASPVFFLAVYFTMQLGARLEKGFSVFVALLLIGLGIFSIYSASNLFAVPIVDNSTLPISPFQSEIPVQDSGILTINVENHGYVPIILLPRQDNRSP